MITEDALDSLHRALSRDIVERCELCAGTGGLPYFDGVERIIHRCECRRRVDQYVRLAGAEVPREFWDVATLDLEWNADKQAEVRKYCEHLVRAKEHGLGFLFTGENGVGKTACACFVLDQALRGGFTAHYFSFHNLIALIRRGQRDWKLRERLDKALRCSFMVLDELGKEGSTRHEEYVVSELDSMLRKRRHELKCTVVVTNLEADKVGEVYGASVDSLLSDRMKVLAFRPGDYRKREGAGDAWERSLVGDGE